MVITTPTTPVAWKAARESLGSVSPALPRCVMELAAPPARPSPPLALVRFSSDGVTPIVVRFHLPKDVARPRRLAVAMRRAVPVTNTEGRSGVATPVRVLGPTVGAILRDQVVMVLEEVASVVNAAG